jgi:hypothetical protein
MSETLLSKPVLKVKLHASNEERNKILSEVRRALDDGTLNDDDSVRESLLRRLTALQRDAKLCERSADALQLEHGVALSQEMFYSLDLAHLDVQYRLSALSTALNDEQKRADIFERYAAIVEHLNKAARVFNAYADKAMLERCLETLANVYRRTGL